LGAGHVGDKYIHQVLVAAVAVERPEDGQRPGRAQAGQSLRSALSFGGGSGDVLEPLDRVGLAHTAGINRSSINRISTRIAAGPLPEIYQKPRYT
jgi:hypothetical protein